MLNIEDIKEAAKTKLTGYTDKEIECFVQGVLYMAGHLPQKRSEEWYQEQARRKKEGEERSGALCEHFKQVTGLGAAVENLNKRKPVAEHVDDALGIVFKGIMEDAEYRKTMLDMMGAEDKAVSQEIILHVKESCKAFNKTHETQLVFEQIEENDGKWTLAWDEPLK